MRENGAKKITLRSRRAFGAICFLLPSIAGVTAFVLLPFADVILRSFQNGTGRFDGLSNYSAVIENDAFLMAAGNSAKFVLVCIPLLLAVSLAVTLIASAARWGKEFFKTSFLLPMAVPTASIVLLWQLLFDNNGIINGVLNAFNLPVVDWMGSNCAFYVLVLSYLWKNTGYNMVLWLSGLGGIPKEYYEAARIDGAGAWQEFIYITLPQLRSTLGIVAVLALINSFKVFREAYLVAGGYPDKSIYLLQHLFNNWFVKLELPKLYAAAVLLAAAILIVILVFRFILNKRGDEQ